MMFALALGLSAATLSKGVAGRAWMWATGALNVAGYVQNSRSFAVWMWGSGKLWLGGLVENSRSF